MGTLVIPVPACFGLRVLLLSVFLSPCVPLSLSPSLPLSLSPSLPLSLPLTGPASASAGPLHRCRSGARGLKSHVLSRDSEGRRGSVAVTAGDPVKAFFHHHRAALCSSLYCGHRHLFLKAGWAVWFQSHCNRTASGRAVHPNAPAARPSNCAA